MSRSPDPQILRYRLLSLARAPGSWWVGVPREAWGEAVARQLPRWRLLGPLPIDEQPDGREAWSIKPCHNRRPHHGDL